MLSSFRLRIWVLSFWMLIPMGTLIFMSHPVDMILRFAHFIFGIGYFSIRSKGEFVLGLPNTPDLRDASGAVCAADFDRDGDLDLFVGGQVVPGKYPVTPNSRLLVNQGGIFSDQTKNLSPRLLQAGLVNSAVWSDYDGDGWIDLWVACEWGPIRVWRNENGVFKETTESLGLSNTKGWWTSILPVDIDSDGDMDYAVGNLGYNTKYNASMKEPLVLHWGEMDDSGKQD